LNGWPWMTMSGVPSPPSLYPRLIQLTRAVLTP
jgi:hypothetical protein